MRTINAPGVEWREIDRSQYSPSMVGTGCYVQGFTTKGEPYKPMEFTSRGAWTTYYGTPDNEAERYSYAAACEVLDQGGRLYFARLPYYNSSFEKMVGVKYKVSTQLSTDSNCAKDFKEVIDADPEIEQFALIEGGYDPIAYSLSAIDEYRTNESKVPAGTFLIVDTTGGTYGKVTEDYRKGTEREVIGIVPVVTTAANAMYAQSLIEVEKTNVWHYETVGCENSETGLSVPVLKTLAGESSSNSNDGLLQTDMAELINTHGFFKKQVCTFRNVTIRNNALYELDGDLENIYGTLKQFIEDYSLGSYDMTTISGIKKFVTDAKENKIVVNIKDESDGNLSSYVDNAQLIIDAITSSKWTRSDDGGIIESDEFEAYLSVYNDNADSIDFILSNYIDEASIKIGNEYANDGSLHQFAYGTLKVAEPLATPIVRSVAGDNSVPHTLALDANNYFSTIQPAADGEGFDPEHLKDIGVVVYKTYLDASEGNKVSFEPVEAYCGSLCKDDVDPNTGVTKFIDTIINSQSKYINFFSNCFNSKAEKKWYKEECDILFAKHSQGASLGFYSDMTSETINISKSIYDGMNKAFEKVSDINALDIDIVCDAGLANIASFIKAVYGEEGAYDLQVTDDLGNSLLGLWKAESATSPSVKMWKTVEQKIDTFCKKTRKDCMGIIDGLRPLVLQGDRKIIRDSKPANTIDANILPYLKSVTGLNSSYLAEYIDWFEEADDYSGDFFWCPPSIKAMGVYINTDVNFNYWDAPAGLNRGQIAATDVAFSPTMAQAGAIYTKNLNYAINYPDEGIILEGQKTTQVKPSAFDRVNVRRLFLRLERQSYKVARYYVYEGNTAYTRQRLVDALEPYFKSAKVGGGIYDYRIVCDETINTPEVIDNNELKVRIGIKPTKTIEFIELQFVAGRTGGSWEEIMR